MKFQIRTLFMLLTLVALAIPGLRQDWNAYAEIWLKGEPYYPSGARIYDNGEPYFRQITSGFAEPFFFPVNINESMYYPYFGEDFFRSGYDPYETSQRAIEAQRQKFESPYYDLFGKSFLGDAEPYQF